MVSLDMSLKDATDFVRERRRFINPNPGFLRELGEEEVCCRGGPWAGCRDTRGARGRATAATSCCGLNLPSHPPPATAAWNDHHPLPR